MRLILRVVLTVVTGFAAVIAAVSPATASPIRVWGVFMLKNMGTGKCLDAFAGEGGGNGNRVGLWECNFGPTEKWNLTTNYSTSIFDMKIINAATGRSLDYPASSGGAPGSQYLLWDYVNSPGQRYSFLTLNPNNWKQVTISVQLGGGQVMDAFASGGGRNGNPVGNWNRTGSPLQHWELIQVGSIP